MSKIKDAAKKIEEKVKKLVRGEKAQENTEKITILEEKIANIFDQIDALDQKKVSVIPKEESSSKEIDEVALSLEDDADAEDFPSAGVLHLPINGLESLSYADLEAFENDCDFIN